MLLHLALEDVIFLVGRMWVELSKIYLKENVLLHCSSCSRYIVYGVIYNIIECRINTGSCNIQLGWWVRNLPAPPITLENTSTLGILLGHSPSSTIVTCTIP